MYDEGERQRSVGRKKEESHAHEKLLCVWLSPDFGSPGRLDTTGSRDLTKGQGIEAQFPQGLLTIRSSSLATGCHPAGKGPSDKRRKKAPRVTTGADVGPRRDWPGRPDWGPLIT